MRVKQTIFPIYLVGLIILVFILGTGCITTQADVEGINTHNSTNSLDKTDPNTKNLSPCEKIGKFGEGWEICGITCFHSSNQTCCNNQVYEGLRWEKCEGICFNNNTQSCIEGKIFEGQGWQPCADTYYNPFYQSCCNNKVWEGRRWRECGTTCYNTLNQSCCEGKIRTGLHCPSSTTYDPDAPVSPQYSGSTSGPTQCGDQYCPQGWSCRISQYGTSCYNPSEGGVSCGSQICPPRWSCCWGTAAGPTCYDPQAGYMCVGSDGKEY